jgi:putative membrane protein
MSRSLKTALIIGGIILAVIVILSVVPGLLWGWQGYGYGMMGPGMMGGYGIMFIMPILWIVVIGLIVWAVVAAIRRPGESDGAYGSSAPALEILKRRYARGEISKEEYEEKKKDLV